MNDSTTATPIKTGIDATNSTNNAVACTEKVTVNSKQPKGWRAVLKVHPAAELFPLMGESELRGLADDIDKHGLREPVTIYDDRDIGMCVLDGRNRLDALERLGREIHRGGLLLPGICQYVGEASGDYDPDDGPFDPYAYVVSRNIHRRHLTAEQCRDLIAKVLKATPAKSNRQIGTEVGASHVTVGEVRRELESTGQIVQLNKTTGRDGKARPARRHTPKLVPPTPDDVVASGPVDALCATLAAMKERDPALAQACFKGIVACLRDAMNSTIEADAPRTAHRRAGGD